MTPSTRTKLKLLLQGIAILFFATAGLAFFFGGGLIHAVRGTDRFVAEIEGFTLAVLFAVLGGCAKAVEDRIELEGEVDPDGPKSLGEALRKWLRP